MKRPQEKPGANNYPEPEAQRRFEDALKAGLATSPKPLKEKPKLRKSSVKKPGRPSKSGA